MQETLPPTGKTDLRGFEWYYLDRLLRSPAQQLKGHTDFVYSVAYSRDGGRLASASKDGTVDSGTRPPAGPSAPSRPGVLYAVAFHPDGSRLASAGGERVVTVWDAATGQSHPHLGRAHARTFDELAFSPDGKTLVSSSTDGTVKFWDVATGSLTRTLEDRKAGDFGEIAFSPDGKILASAGGGERTVRLYDTATGAVIHTLGQQEAAAAVNIKSSAGRHAHAGGFQCRRQDRGLPDRGWSDLGLGCRHRIAGSYPARHS